MIETQVQYLQEAAKCRDLFVRKMEDYGTAWRILRLSSLVDQIFIKAKRIRNLEENEMQMVEDAIDSEYMGIVNYGLMALIQKDCGIDDEMSMPKEKVIEQYDKYLGHAKELMLLKNHDYGEAWRTMNRSSLTDLILMKVLRTRQIMSNEGKTIASEGIDANFLDMINYALFALIKITEGLAKSTAT
ncbi:MAG: DUF1599 domain-containing protein [Saprospiraceae bacterium]|nr:DUF1599 domain-containing protein [Saprospiraceae bacterium]